MDEERPRGVGRFVAEAVQGVRGGGQATPQRRTFSARRGGAHQYCLFLKPWTTHPGTDLWAVLDVVLAGVAKHRLAVDEVAVIPGAYLRTHGTMSAHYWRMSGLARGAADRFQAEAWRKFHEVFGPDAEPAAVLGGFEFLDRFAEVSPLALEFLWENLQQHKLGASITCARAAVGNATLYLVNGFVPNLLRGYERADSVVIAFALSGSLPWREARQAFAGHTDPLRAAEGSLRHTLFARQAELGVSDLRLGANGVHLSAGPLEALAELIRLMSRGPGDLRRPGDFAFGARLDQTFGGDATQAFLANPVVSFRGTHADLFELTEELDADEAIALLAAIQDQLP